VLESPAPVRSPDPALVTYDAIDRAATLSFRPAGLSRGAVTAALAAATGNTDILHTPERERQIVSIATSVDCRDGGTGTARDYVDGVPVETSAAVAQIFKTLAEMVPVTEHRPF